jgi:type I restriction enzyme, S subunit
MIADLKPYAEYKESGLPWLGQVPGHWDVFPNRALFSEVKDRNHPDEEMLSVTITRGIVRQTALLEGSSKKDSSNLDKSAYKLVQPRDIAYNKMRAWQGAIGASALRGIISPAYVIMRLRNADDLPSYFHHLYRTPQFAKEAQRWSYGITSDMWSLRPEHFKMIYTPEPPPAEQTAIVRFLDWANGRLERAIRAKRKVIALLGEQKQAIIHRAVTRGLDPSVPLKPSGIPWLGDIPRHWETPLLGRLLARVAQGWSPVAAEGELELDQWAVLTLSAVRRGVFNPSAIKPVSLTASIPTGIEVGEGDVLLTRSNTRDRVGDVCIVRTPRPKTILCDLIYRLQVRAGAIVPEFLVYQLLSRVGRGQIERDARGSSGTMPKISQGHIKSWRILRPPVGEQQRIVESIDVNSAPVNTAISRLEREIDLLREYRTRLVADVVTGKLDVREAAARLPEAAPPDVTEDDPMAADEEGAEDAADAENTAA